MVDDQRKLSLRGEIDPLASTGMGDGHETIGVRIPSGGLLDPSSFPAQRPKGGVNPAAPASSWNRARALGGLINGFLGNTGDPNEGSQLPKPLPHSTAPVVVSPGFPHRDGLDLPDDLVQRINGLYGAGGGGFVVTSGRRNAGRQATAMYDNYVANQSPSYVNRAAAAAVRDAYDRGARQGLTRGDVVANMAAVLQGQMDSGVYLSRHQTSRAMDIASTAPKSVVDAIASNPSVQSITREATHWHVQFR